MALPFLHQYVVVMCNKKIVQTTAASVKATTAQAIQHFKKSTVSLEGHTSADAGTKATLCFVFH